MTHLKDRVVEHLAQAAPDLEVLDLEPLVGGACQDNFRMEARRGEVLEQFVLRSDAPRSLAGSVHRGVELQVINAAVAAGVTTPPARWPATGLVREGAEAYFLDWRDGVAIGRKVVRDPQLAKAREGLVEVLAGELTRIHSITPESEELEVLGDADIDPARTLLAAVRQSLDGAGDRPALELAFRWLEEHAPPRTEVTLVHGDFRTGNFLITPQGLSAILDWEFVHWGAPAEDLAWVCVRDWRFGQLDQPVGGFGQRDALRNAYRQASGRTVEPAELHWWEVYGNVRWATGCIQQGLRYASGEQDLELIAIARRAAEMEYEALRLIHERGREGGESSSPGPRNHTES